MKILLKKCWDISKELAEKSTSNTENKKFYCYSAMHYKVIYDIVRAKLDTISDPILKIGYIDSLMMNYADLGSEKINSIFDILCGIVSGSILGFSLTDISLSGEEIIVTVIIIFVVQALKAANLLCRKYNFYNLVLRQIKDDLEQM